MISSTRHTNSEECFILSQKVVNEIPRKHRKKFFSLLTDVPLPSKNLKNKLVNVLQVPLGHQEGAVKVRGLMIEVLGLLESNRAR